MAADLSRIAKIINQELNLADSYTATPDDPRFYNLSDVILACDAQTVSAFLKNPTDGRRAGFLSTQSLAHGAGLPTHIGPIESVTIASKGAVLARKDKIERERENALNLTTISPHYWIEANTIFHNADAKISGVAGALFGVTVASVKVCTFSMGVVCQSPDELEIVVACGALAMLAPVEGENVSLASHYQGQFLAMLSALEKGQPLPEFIPRSALKDI